MNLRCSSSANSLFLLPHATFGRFLYKAECTEGTTDFSAVSAAEEPQAMIIKK